MSALLASEKYCLGGRTGAYGSARGGSETLVIPLGCTIGGRGERMKETLEAIIKTLERIEEKIDKATDRIGSQLDQATQRP